MPRQISVYEWKVIVESLRSEKFYLCSQEELAKMVGVSVYSISKWERGVVEPGIKHQRKLKELCEKKRYYESHFPLKSQKFGVVKKKH